MNKTCILTNLHIIYLLKKDFNDNEEDDEFDQDEYVLYHEYRDDPITYDNYLQIAKNKGLISNYEEYDEDISEYLNMGYDM